MSSAQHRHHDRLAWSFIHRGDDVVSYSLRTCFRLCLRIQSAAVIDFWDCASRSFQRCSSQLTPPRTQCTCQQLSRNLTTCQTIVTLSNCQHQVLNVRCTPCISHAASRPGQLCDQQALVPARRTCTCSPLLPIRSRVVELCCDTSMMSA
jgi:hypothetical protein